MQTHIYECACKICMYKSEFVIFMNICGFMNVYAKKNREENNKVSHLHSISPDMVRVM